MREPSPIVLVATSSPDVASNDSDFRRGPVVQMELEISVCVDRRWSWGPASCSLDVHGGHGTPPLLSLLKFLTFSSLFFHHIILNTPKDICSEY
jgi:hypothetical protein